MEIEGALFLHAEDYKEPETAFLNVVRRLAYEGYSFEAVEQGFSSAYKKAFTDFRFETIDMFDGMGAEVEER